MIHSLSDEQVRLLRAKAQWLGEDRVGPHAKVAQVAMAVVGLQAQDAPAASLSIRARSAGLTQADVGHARVAGRSVVRTWLMRGTLHLAAAEDIHWLLALLGPIFARGGRRRRAQLGLDDKTSASGVDVIRHALAAKGPLSREQIATALTASGIQVEGQATYHLVYLAALQGIACFGPDAAGGKPSFVLLDDWLERGPVIPREEALGRLALRYLEAFGPAGPEDVASWSGLPMSDARTAWKRILAQLVEVETAAGIAWMLKAHKDRLDDCSGSTAPQTVRLLPAYDTYLLGYRSRAIAVPPKHARRVHPGGGVIRPALLVNGRVRGIWATKRRRQELEVVVEPFATLNDDEMPQLEAEAADIGRFLDTAITLTIQAPLSS